VRVKPRVLMVTGAYFPETSGGGLQARAVIRALRHDADFVVLTTSADPSLPEHSDEDGIAIRRVHVDVQSAVSTLTAAARFAAAFVGLSSRIDIVNLHGFSRKAIMLAVLSRLFGKRFVLTLQTSVHDEPPAARDGGWASDWAYRSADLYLSVSPGISRGYLNAQFPASRLRQVSNAVETDRFRPALPGEREALRCELGLPRDLALVLFVGFFSRDKRPDVAYRAWSEIALRDAGSGLLMIGATRAVHGEVDTVLASAIRERAVRDGVADRMFFVESTTAIEKYFRTADVYVLPSVREGLPLALLEAMSSGLPCVASRLDGSTDVLIEDQVNGLLVATDDGAGMARAVGDLLTSTSLAARLGAAARATVLDRYAIQAVAPSWLAAYQELSRS
jgi:glycosyltransferase involved in cell wall biosynthesis